MRLLHDAGDGIMSRKVLVVGGAGYIGSHMVKLLLTHGEQPVVLDDLSSGHRDAVLPGTLFVQGSSGDRALLDRLFDRYDFDTVTHFASSINVSESVMQPGRYYDNNVCNTLTLLNAMARKHIPYFVFSSTAAIFGNPQKIPIDEQHRQAPINPYGRSKWMIEQLLPDYESAYGMRHVCLRYFNAAGADPEGMLGERHEPETHLIPLALRAAMRTTRFTLYGNDYDTPDGTCIRDYIHVADLCSAHLLAIRHLRSGRASNMFNLGNGNGYSVREVLGAVERIVGRPCRTQLAPRRQGDPARLVADASKAQALLGWRPAYPRLDDIITHAFHWEASQEERYAQASG
jgi:UDP-glucose 4-epimerase